MQDLSLAEDKPAGSDKVQDLALAADKPADSHVLAEYTGCDAT